MKLKEKKIAFCLTNVFYTFTNTIAEMKKIVEEGRRNNTYNGRNYLPK